MGYYEFGDIVLVDMDDGRREGYFIIEPVFTRIKDSEQVCFQHYKAVDKNGEKWHIHSNNIMKKVDTLGLVLARMEEAK